mgnify:CR=1 FL=1
MSKVKLATSVNENLGMKHYRENYQGVIRFRKQQINHERAKSASTYHLLINKKEIESAGGDYKTLLRLKKKIELGESQMPSYQPYRQQAPGLN